jgi:hypothetical protein
MNVPDCNYREETIDRQAVVHIQIDQARFARLRTGLLAQPGFDITNVSSREGHLQVTVWKKTMEQVKQAVAAIPET